MLAAVPIALAVIMNSTNVARPDLVLVVGLALFGLPFAVNSSLHSYLILAYAGSEKAAEDVGFYYAANAAGPLLGITLSGVLYQVRRHHGLSDRLSRHAAALLPYHIPHSAQRRRIGRQQATTERAKEA